MNLFQEIINKTSQDDNSFAYLNLEKRKSDPEEPKNVTNKRQYWIQKTADMLNISFRSVLWKTINWKEPWIADMYAYCMKEGKPPAKLWFGLYKKSKKSKL